MRVQVIRVAQKTAWLILAVQAAADEYGRMEPEERRECKEEMTAVFRAVLAAANEKSVMATLLGTAAALLHVLDETREELAAGAPAVAH